MCLCVCVCVQRSDVFDESTEEECVGKETKNQNEVCVSADPAFSQSEW